LAPQVPTGVPLVVLLFGEAFAGFALGFLTRLTLFILSMVGAIVAQSLSLSQIFGAGISEDSNTTISTVLTIAGATLFVTTGLHVLTIELFVETYRLFPAGTVFADNATGRVAEHLIEVSGGAIAFSVSLALPFLLMNLAYNVLLGVLNRAMPQLMVTFVGMPAITLTGLVLLTIGIGGVLTLWLDIAGDLLLGMSP
jgi:flagellar biosynthetic protein FliR